MVELLAHLQFWALKTYLYLLIYLHMAPVRLIPCLYTLVSQRTMVLVPAQWSRVKRQDHFQAVEV